MENIVEGTTDSNIEWFYQRNCWNLSHQSNIGNTKTQKRQIYFQIVAEKQNTPIMPNVWSTKTQNVSEEEGGRNNAVRPSFQMRFEEQMFPDDLLTFSSLQHGFKTQQIRTPVNPCWRVDKMKHCQRHYGPRRWLLWPIIEDSFQQLHCQNDNHKLNVVYILWNCGFLQSGNYRTHVGPKN